MTTYNRHIVVIVLVRWISCVLCCQALPQGLLFSCDVARKSENRSKNRYGNIVACKYNVLTVCHLYCYFCVCIGDAGTLLLRIMLYSFFFFFSFFRTKIRSLHHPINMYDRYETLTQATEWHYVRSLIFFNNLTYFTGEFCVIRHFSQWPICPSIANLRLM